jgi:predicted RND superfamily exporter protein
MFLVNRHKSVAILLLSLILVLTGLAFSLASKIQFSYDFERFFPEDNEEFTFYQAYRKEFLVDVDPILVGVGLGSGLSDSVELSRLRQLTKSLKEIEGVRKLRSVTELKYPLITPFMTLRVPFIDENKKFIDSVDSTFLVNHPLLGGIFVSKDLQNACIFLEVDYDLDKASLDRIILSIDQCLSDLNYQDVQVAGRLADQAYITNKLVSETVLFAGIAFLLVLIFLWFVYRRLSDVLIPVFIVLISCIWVLATMNYFGKSIDLMSSLIPTILFVIGISDVVHLNARFRDEMSKGNEKLESLKNAIKEVGIATIITSVTTCIGFLSLLSSDITPIREFGIYVSIGVCYSLILTYAIFPSLSILLPYKNRNETKSNPLWSKLLPSWLQFTLRHSKAVLACTTVLFVISALASFHLKSNVKLLDDLPKNDPFKKSFEYLEDRFGGVRQMDMVVASASGESLLTLDYVKQIAHLEEFIESNYEVSGMTSLGNLFKTYQMATGGGAIDQFKMPETDNELRRINREIHKLGEQDRLKMLLSDDESKYRLMGRIKDMGSEEILSRDQRLMSFARENCPKLNVQITGLGHLIDVNNRKLTKDLSWGLLYALISVSILMAFLYRSLPMVLIAFVVNLLPLLMIGLVMFLSGIELKVSTMLIFAVSFGIAVDDTIHFLSRLKVEMENGKSLLYAIKRSFLSTGKALILTSVILMVGFIPLVWSQFMSSYYFGVLVTSTLLFALLADLFLLPILLSKLKFKKKAR